MLNEELRAAWNDENGLYCVEIKKGRKWVFKEPLEILSVQKMDRGSRKEVLQQTHYKRTGAIDWNIGISDAYDEKLAKEFGCW